MTNGIPVTVPPEEVQAIATEMTMREYLQTVLLRDEQGRTLTVFLEEESKT